VILLGIPPVCVRTCTGWYEFILDIITILMGKREKLLRRILSGQIRKILTTYKFNIGKSDE